MSELPTPDEINQLKQQLAEAKLPSVEHVQLVYELQRARRDTDRLDWIDNNYLSSDFYLGLMGELDVRKSIDTAIAAKGDERKRRMNSVNNSKAKQKQNEH